MKLLHEYFIQELTYKYDDENEKAAHKLHMEHMGFQVNNSTSIFTVNPLVVTYQKRQLNDNIARL